MKKKLVSFTLAIMVVISLFAVPASAAGVTLLKVQKINNSASVFGNQKFCNGWNDKDSAKTVYLDMKYYNGSSWVYDSGASIAPNCKLNSSVWSNKKGAEMSWRLWINTYAALYTGSYAYGEILY